MMIELMTAWLMGASAAVPAGAAENRRGPTPGGGQVAPGPDGEARLATLLAVLRADAAKRGGHNDARLVVLPAEDVVWSDGSLGCPQPGLVYTQALVPGWRVRIESGAEVLTYHASRRGQWVLCPAGLDGAPTLGAVTR